MASSPRCGRAPRRRTAQPHWRLYRTSRRDHRAFRRGPADSARLQPLSMIHLTKSLVRRWMGQLLHVDDTPERTAAAFALGVFIGFSPFLGLHTILGIVFAFLLNVNRVAVLLGVYSNLPWIMAPYYTLTTIWIGQPLTRTHIPPGFKS